MEPLLIAVFLAAIASIIPNRRTAFALIVLVTVLNVMASGMMIVCRSLGDGTTRSHRASISDRVRIEDGRLIEAH